MYIRTGSRWIPWLDWGLAERRRRGGTINGSRFLDLQKALELAIDEMDDNTKHYIKLRKTTSFSS